MRCFNSDESKEVMEGLVIYYLPLISSNRLCAGLKPGDELDRTIDGISGATLSTRALTKLARLALYLHQRSAFADAPN